MNFGPVFNAMKSTRADLARRAQQLQRFGPLLGLEIFTGAGGLGTGLDMPGFVESSSSTANSSSSSRTNESSTIML